MTKEDYAAAKKMVIKNLEKDTYVKVDDEYVLDRYEYKPAFVFNFSDSVERRLYLYLLLAGENMDTLGMVLFYQTPADGKVINLPIPGPKADRACWDLYIDDLKYTGEDVEGFLPTVAFVVSREMSLLLDSSGAGEEEEEGEFEYCFPAGMTVVLEGGQELSLGELEPGQKILGWSAEEKTTIFTEVEAIHVHKRKEIPLIEAQLVSLETIHLTSDAASVHSLLKGTASHPVLTHRGKVRMDELQAGEIVFQWDAQQQRLLSYEVAQLGRAKETVREVYEVRTTAPLFFVNGVLVFVK